MEQDCTQAVEVAFLRDLGHRLLHKVLELLALGAEAAVVRHGDLEHLFAELGLLGGDVLLRTCAAVVPGDAVGLLLNVSKAVLVSLVRRAVEEVLELHVLQFFVTEENRGWAQIRVHYIALVKQLE